MSPAARSASRSRIDRSRKSRSSVKSATGQGLLDQATVVRSGRGAAHGSPPVEGEPEAGEGADQTGDREHPYQARHPGRRWRQQGVGAEPGHQIAADLAVALALADALGDLLPDGLR